MARGQAHNKYRLNEQARKSECRGPSAPALFKALLSHSWWCKPYRVQNRTSFPTNLHDPHPSFFTPPFRASLAPLVKNWVWFVATISERPSRDPQVVWTLPDTHLRTLRPWLAVVLPWRRRAPTPSRAGGTDRCHPLQPRRQAPLLPSPPRLPFVGRCLAS